MHILIYSKRKKGNERNRNQYIYRKKQINRLKTRKCGRKTEITREKKRAREIEREKRETVVYIYIYMCLIYTNKNIKKYE